MTSPATIHLQKIAPASIEEKGIANSLYAFLRDRDPQVLCNSRFALSVLLKDKAELPLR